MLTSLIMLCLIIGWRTLGCADVSPSHLAAVAGLTGSGHLFARSRGASFLVASPLPDAG